MHIQRDVPSPCITAEAGVSGDSYFSSTQDQLKNWGDEPANSQKSNRETGRELGEAEVLSWVVPFVMDEKTEA